MSTKENENIVRRYLDEVFKGNIDAAGELLADNYICYEPGEEPANRAATIASNKAYRKAFPDMRLSNVQITGEGDTVTVRSKFEGTHRGEFAGMPASGNKFSLPYTIHFRVANGKIVEERDEYDPEAFMRALGTPHTKEHGL